MRIVIDIPKEIYESLKNGMINENQSLFICGAAKEGTILPDGHGRLIDADTIAGTIEKYRDFWKRDGNLYESGRYESYDIVIDEISIAPTILGADKA